jgi:protein TonB
MKNKIKAMRSRQAVTDEEIQRYMDFDKLLQQKDLVAMRQRKIKIFRYASLALVTLAIGVFFVWKFVPDNSDNQVSATRENQKANVPVNPSSSDSAASVQQIAGEKEALSELPDVEKRQTESRKQQAQKQHTEITPAQPNEASEKINEGVYIQAEPVNGYPDLYAFFDRELTYPKEAMKDSVAGVVTVKFTVDKDGQARNVVIENSLGSLFDQEVNRVVSEMPAWKPATYNGKPVTSKISIPLTFQLQKIKN